MRLWVLLLLTALTVWGTPLKGEEKQLTAPKTIHQPRDVMVRGAKEGKSGSVRQCKTQCASGIAQKAAAAAKAAQGAQNSAASQAAHMVKTQLAEKALGAAKVAETALAGKQALVEELHSEVKTAETVVMEDTAAVRHQESTVSAAMNELQQATAYHKVMCQATQMAASLEKQAHCVLEKAKSGLAQKCHDLAEAKARLAQLQHKLQCACSDCAATKAAAHCACEAARAACGNTRKKKHANDTEIISNDKQFRTEP